MTDSDGSQSSAYGPRFWATYLSNIALMVAVSLLFRYADFVAALGDTTKALMIQGFAACALFLIGCAGLQHESATVLRSDKSSLDETYAQFRAAQVSQPRYRLSMDLTQADEFGGVMVVDFNLHRNDQPLTLDFAGGRVDRVEINGQGCGAHGVW